MSAKVYVDVKANGLGDRRLGGSYQRIERENKVKTTYRDRQHQRKMNQALMCRRKTDDCLGFRPSGGEDQVGLASPTSKSRNEGLGVGRKCRASRDEGCSGGAGFFCWQFGM